MQHSELKCRWWSWTIVNVVISPRCARQFGELICGYVRKLQTYLKLSRPCSWNYEPGFVVFYFVANKLFSYIFKQKKLQTERRGAYAGRHLIITTNCIWRHIEMALFLYLFIIIVLFTSLLNHQNHYSNI